MRNPVYLQLERPWMDIYGTRIPSTSGKRKSLSHDRPAVSASCVDCQSSINAQSEEDEEEEEEELAPIQKLLDDNLLMHVLSHMPTHSIGMAACVCQTWRRVAETPVLWEKACGQSFTTSSAEENRQELRDLYNGSWKRMYLSRPHLRYDGIYVSRNTYIRVGEQSFRVKHAVHLVLYFRYLRFLPDGQLVYRTAPHIPSVVAPTLLNYEKHVGPWSHSRDGVNVMHGRWLLQPQGRLFTSVMYPGNKSTEVRCKMHLRSTSQGANNRLDIKSLVMYDRELGRSVPLPGKPTCLRLALMGCELGEAESEEEAHIPGRKTSSRGLKTYVFIPWEYINSSELNLPVEEMDYYVPG